MAHICTARLACHAEVKFTLVSMGDDVTRSRSIELVARYTSVIAGHVVRRA